MTVVGHTPGQQQAASEQDCTVRSPHLHVLDLPLKQLQLAPQVGSLCLQLIHFPACPVGLSPSCLLQPGMLVLVTTCNNCAKQMATTDVLSARW